MLTVRGKSSEPAKGAIGCAAEAFPNATITAVISCHILGMQLRLDAAGR